jgi:hypothetical protein
MPHAVFVRRLYFFSFDCFNEKRFYHCTSNIFATNARIDEIISESSPAISPLGECSRLY